MNISTEICRACGHFTDDINASNVYPGYCLDCAEEVVAFRPNADLPEEWYFVTSDEDLPEPIELGPAQCGFCGGGFFRAAQRDGLGIVVTCIDGEYADGHHESCGMSRATRLMPAHKVIF